MRSRCLVRNLVLGLVGVCLSACAPSPTASSTSGVSTGVNVQAAATIWNITVEAKYSAILAIHRSGQPAAVHTVPVQNDLVETAPTPNWRDRMNNEKWLAGVRVCIRDDSNGRQEPLLARRHLQQAGALMVSEDKDYDYWVGFSVWDNLNIKLITTDSQPIYSCSPQHDNNWEQPFYRALLDDYSYQVENRRLADKIKR